MSEFGNEALTATMKLNEKTIEAMLKLLKYLLEREERELNKQLKKLQLDKINSESDIQKAEEYLARKKGVVQAKEMMATGREIVPLSIPMNEKQFERFGELAQEYGINTYCTSTNIIYNQMKEVKEEIAEKKDELDKLKKEISKELKALDANKEWDLNNLNSEELEEKLHFNSKLSSYMEKEVQLNNEIRAMERKLDDLSRKSDDKIAWVFADDLERVKAITERMNMEIMIQKCNERVEELQAKPSLTKEEEKELRDLLKEKSEMLNNEFEELNNRNNEVMLQSSDEEYKNISFDEAIGTVTNRKYGEQPCYICNRINPDNYAEINVEQRENKNPKLPPTTITQFNVYKDGIQQECNIDGFPHNRFEHWSNKKGENSGKKGKDYWKQMKEQMKEVLSDDVIIFSNKKDYLEFKDNFKKIKDEKTPDSMKNEHSMEASVQIGSLEEKAGYKGKDYIDTLNQLKTELEKNGMIINDKKELCDKETGKIIKINSQMPRNEKFVYKEAEIIKKQMNVCETLYKKQIELNTWQEQLQLNNKNLEMLENTDEKRILYEQMSESLHKEVYSRKQDISALDTKLTNLQGEREKIMSISAYEKMKNERKAEQQFNLEDEITKTEVDMSYEEFEQEFDSQNDKGYKVSREYWNKIMNDENTLSNSGSTKDITKEIESNLPDPSIDR